MLVHALMAAQEFTAINNYWQTVFRQDIGPCHGMSNTDLIAMPPVRCRFTRLMTGSPTKAQQTKLQGLYMYGGVGVGKTMLMDLLAHSAPSSFQVCAPSQPQHHPFLVQNAFEVSPGIA